MYRQVYIQKSIHTDKYTYRQAYIQTSIHTEKYTYRQSYIQTSIHTDKYTYRQAYIHYTSCTSCECANMSNLTWLMVIHYKESRKKKSLLMAVPLRPRAGKGRPLRKKYLFKNFFFRRPLSTKGGVKGLKCTAIKKNNLFCGFP